MSDYRVDTYELTDPPLRGWSYRVYQPDAPMGPVWCYCATQADAERIARALTLLDRLPAGVVEAIVALPPQEPQP